MRFWKKLFSRKKEEEDDLELNWEDIIYERDNVDFDDEEQRSRYIINCVEQMAEAAKETELLTGEYTLVTSYLMDMEEIEALPDMEKKELERIALLLQSLEKEREHFKNRKNIMKDADFYQMRGQEQEIEEGIKKIKEGENYAGMIKQDLVRLDRERHAYDYRKQELETIRANFRGMTVIFLGVFLICMVILLALQLILEMNVVIGYFIAILATAIAITVLCVKNMDAQKEQERVKRAINKLIQLQNKVKIRYVNNTYLLDYLYMKYNVDSAVLLEKRWTDYQQEKEDRKQYADVQGKLEIYQKQLTAQLSRYRVRDPQRWVNQVAALLDNREMVEIRHEMILRRQSLRKQLDYNKKVAENAHEEIMDVVKLHPEFATEILGMVGRYQ